VTDVQPFRALRYDPKRVELARVLVPPYDVISPEERVRLWERDPHCAIRLELTREVDEESRTDYADVAKQLAEWRRSGVLVHDARPAFYALRQRFPGPDGAPVERVGFFAALRLEDYGKRVVRPHERTLAAPKADRLKLLRATRTNLSSVFCLYEDRELALGALLASALEGAACAQVRDADGVEHTLARVEDAGPVGVLRRFLAERPCVIADGHHRYETALQYRDERLRDAPGAAEDAPFRSILAYFANAWAPGTLLLPIHRVILKGAAPTDAIWRERLAGWQERSVAVERAEDLPGLLARHLAGLHDRHAFAADDGSGRLRVFSRPRDGELDVRVVHREVLHGVFGLDDAAVRDGAVDFPKSALAAALQVRAGRGAVAIFLNPLEAEDVFRVTAAGELLPQKSTFFHPKLPTGLVFRSLEEAG
jgi:uncharacterized protein (DUF1015 family)